MAAKWIGKVIADGYFLKGLVMLTSAILELGTLDSLLFGFLVTYNLILGSLLFLFHLGPE